MTETPNFEGPLLNPDWTEEQNRRYDEAENRNTPALARNEALIGAESGPMLKDIAEKAKGMVDSPTSKPAKPATSSTRPYRARYKDTTDFVTRQLKDI